jgi:hypothetical protein
MKILVANIIEFALKLCHDEEPSCHVGPDLEKFVFQLSKKNLFAFFVL